MFDELHHAEPPRWAVDTVAEIGKRVETWLRKRHPELSQEAVEALAN